MRALLTLIFLAVAGNVTAEVIQKIKINGMDEPVEFINNYNLERCLELDLSKRKVIQLDERTCNGLKNYYAKQAEREKEAQLRAEENRKTQEEYELRRQQEIARREQERKEADEQFLAKYRAEKAAEEAAREKQEAEWDRMDREAEKKREAKIAATKARCGTDYKNPTIGMRIERVKDCVAPVKLVSQINRADGVVSTFQDGSLWVNVMEGRVVAWGK